MGRYGSLYGKPAERVGGVPGSQRLPATRGGLGELPNKIWQIGKEKKMILKFTDGIEIVIDENDYLCSANSPEKF